MLFDEILSSSTNEVTFDCQSEWSLHHRLTAHAIPIVLTLDQGSMDDVNPS